MEKSKLDMWKDGSLKFYSDIESINLHLSCVEESVHKIVGKIRDLKGKEEKKNAQKQMDSIRAKMFLISIVLDLCYENKEESLDN